MLDFHNTLSLLRQSSTYLPSELHSDESERIAYLISRSLPAKGSHTLAELLFTYREYTKALEQQDASSASTVDQTQISSQQRQLKTSLQISYFGQAIANSLFEKQNQTQQYLEARAIIRQRSDLDEAQRKSLLEALTSEYQATLNAGSGSVN
jgi:lipase chaperone LimK